MKQNYLPIRQIMSIFIIFEKKSWHFQRAFQDYKEL